MLVKYVFSAVILNIVKVLVAILCAGLIGLQRTKQYRLAGIQSLAFIAAGATLLMIISLTLSPGIITEPYRIASNVMIGMILLSSVVIIKERGSLDGIVNAAAIWVSAAIGLAIGAGLFLEGIFVTFATFLLLSWLNKRLEN
jgi:putative Mg2+ transporter-C (MgtC) family protein